MRIPRIYTQQKLAENQQIELEESSSHHLGKVLRLNESAELILFNGQGGQYHSSIKAIGKKTILVNIEQFENTNVESPLKIHLGIAVSKGDRMDWVVQKATELGVNEITPLFSMRTEVKLKGDRAEKKIQHWQKIAISACEQSGRTSIPTINKIQQAHQWIDQCESTKKFILHHRTEEKLNSSDNVDNAAILIGPEGGFNAKEIELAEKNNFQSLSLGPRVLRTETAPVSAITLLQSIWGDIK